MATFHHILEVWDAVPCISPKCPGFANKKPLGNHWQITNTRGLLLVLQDSEYFLGCQSHRHLPCNIVKRKKKDWKWRKNTHHLLLGALALDPAFLQAPLCRNGMLQIHPWAFSQGCLLLGSERAD